MCLIQVFICFSILACCIALNNGHCVYTNSDGPQVFISIRSLNESNNYPCIKHDSDNTATFRQHDTMELQCERAIGTKSYLNKMELLQWKLEQFNRDLIVTKQINIFKGISTIKLTLDRYDDGLIARCFTSGNETYNNISVEFKYAEEKSVTGIKEDIKIVNKAEGKMVQNEFANSVILYTPDTKKSSRVILPKHNIFDSITLKDNGTMYAGWANEGFNPENNNLTIIVKTKWVVYVEPATANSGDLFFFLGIGGVSFIAISIILGICYKYCRKKNDNSIENPYAEVYEVARVQPNQFHGNHPNPTPEEGDYAEISLQNDRVVYAQIDIKKTDKSTPVQNSEPYATIIGVMRPSKCGKNVKIFKG